MLDDTTRKILTVIWNVYRANPSIIDIPYISHKSQRTDDQVKESINNLVEEGLILWDQQANTFKVLYSRAEDKPVMWRGWNQ